MTEETKSPGWFSDEVATFGDRLAAAREGAALSQKDLAQHLGVTAATLRKWEADRAEPRGNRVQMLAGMLGVSLVWLLTGEGEGVSAPPGSAPNSADVADALAEIRELRIQMQRSASRLGKLEIRLRAGLQGAA